MRLVRHRLCQQDLVLLFACALVLLVLVSDTTQAASLRVGAGSSLTVGPGSVDLGCGDLNVAGQLALGAGTLAEVRDLVVPGGLSATNGALHLRGDLAATGALATSSATLFLADGCGRTSWSLSNAMALAGLDVASATGKALRLPAGATVSIGESLSLAGTPLLLPVGSTVPGVAALLDLAPGATQSVFAISAGDLHATGQWIALGTPEQFGSVAGGNLQRVFQSQADADAIAIPTLDRRGAAAFALALALAALGVLKSHLIRGA